jgi:hypothetical protein
MQPNSTANIRRPLEVENYPTFSTAAYQPDSENGGELRFKQASRRGAQMTDNSSVTGISEG